MGQAELLADKAILKGAVQRQWQCQLTGALLDVRRAILIEVTVTSGNVSTLLVHGDERDEIIERLIKINKLPSAVSIKVYDGRFLNGRKAFDRELMELEKGQ